MKVGDLVKYRGDFVIPRIFAGDATRQPDLGVIVEVIVDQQTEGTNICVFGLKRRTLIGTRQQKLKY